MSAPPPKKPKSDAGASGAAAVPAAVPAAPTPLAALLQGPGRGIADFLSLDDGAALAQMSRAMHQAVQNVRGPAPTGRALLDDMPLYTQNLPNGDHFAGAPPNTYVMPRYRARAEALAAPVVPAAPAAGAGLLPPVPAAPRPDPLPALATPVRLTASQRGDAPPGPPLTGAHVRFQSKL